MFFAIASGRDSTAFCENVPQATATFNGLLRESIASMIWPAVFPGRPSTIALGALVLGLQHELGELDRGRRDPDDVDHLHAEGLDQRRRERLQRPGLRALRDHHGELRDAHVLECRHAGQQGAGAAHGELEADRRVPRRRLRDLRADLRQTGGLEQLVGVALAHGEGRREAGDDAWGPRSPGERRKARWDRRPFRRRPSRSRHRPLMPPRPLNAATAAWVPST